MSSPSSPSDNDSLSDAQHTSTDNLLDELESIKDLLEESSLDEEELDSGLDIDIPILDDVVPGEPTRCGEDSDSLFDLKSIFEDDPELTIDDATALTPDQAITGESQMDFEGLDADIEIPSFKLSVADVIPSAAVEVSLVPEQAEEPEPVIPDIPLELALPERLDDFTDGFTTPAESPPGVDPAAPEHPPGISAEKEPDIELLIQDLVDEVIPTLEDRLRQRLAAYPAEIIRQLADKYVKN